MTTTKLQKSVFIAILSALLILMTLTGIAYIPIGPLKLTFLVVPVAIAGVILGPTGGFILGTVFGLTSFYTCFGLDPFGAILLGINPVYTFIMCVIPRILCGWLPALIYENMKRTRVNNTFSVSLVCVLTAVLNTVLFLSSLWLFFAKDFASNQDLIAFLDDKVINSITVLFLAFAGINAILEAVTSGIVGTSATKAVYKVMRKS